MLTEIDTDSDTLKQLQIAINIPQYTMINIFPLIKVY